MKIVFNRKTFVASKKKSLNESNFKNLLNLSNEAEFAISTHVILFLYFPFYFLSASTIGR